MNEMSKNSNDLADDSDMKIELRNTFLLSVREYL